MNFLASAESILIIFLMVIPGFLAIKFKVVKIEHIGALVGVMLYVTQPMIAMYGFISKEYETSLLRNMGIVFGFALLIHLLIFIVVKFAFFKDKQKDRASAYTCASIFGNVGFMGFPVISMLFPDSPEVLIYGAIFLAVFNILVWTLGIYIVTGDVKAISIKKILLNPTLIATLIAMILFFVRAKLPNILMKPITFLSDMNTPLSMTILGMRLASTKLSELFKGWGTYLSAFLKLIVMPIIMFLILLPFKSLPLTLRAGLILLSAMPTANVCLAFSEKFEKDVSASSKAILSSTIFSILTIPLMMLLVGV